MEKKTQEKKRLEWVDIVKGFGILLMVIGHTGVSSNIKLFIYGFHMPLFFVLAGYLYGMYDESKYYHWGFLLLLKSKAKAYLIPYLVLFLINLFVETVLEFFLNHGRLYRHNILEYLLAGLYSHDTNMPNCAPLWFLTCLFVSYILFWILLTKRETIMQIIYSIGYIVILIVLCKVETNYGITQLPWHIDVALVASVFMLMGNYLYKCEKNIDDLSVSKRNICCVLLTIIGSVVITLNGRINMVQNQYHNICLFILGASTLDFVIITLTRVYFKNLSQNIRHTLSFWGSNTLIFLGFNYIINLFLRQIFKFFYMEHSIIYSALNIVGVMVGCSIITVFKKNLKCLQGIRNKYKS